MSLVVVNCGEVKTGVNIGMVQEKLAALKRWPLVQRPC